MIHLLNSIILYALAAMLMSMAIEARQRAASLVRV
jgi:hypothetical protein